MREYLLCAVVAAALAYLTTPFARALAIKTGAMAPVRDRDIHNHPTPRFGGVGMFIGVLAALFVAIQLPRLGPVFNTEPTQILSLLGASLLLVIVGMVDDRWELDSLSKLAGQIMAGALLAYGGIAISWIPVGGDNLLVLDPTASVLITVFVVVFTINAINFVDGLDGLAAGIVAIAATGFFGYSYMLSAANGFERAQLATLIAAILAGAALGFLPHNFFRAKVFMGDTGSMLLGMLLAVCTIVLVGKVDPNAVGTSALLPAWSSLLIPLAVLAVPIVDVLLAVSRRTWAGRSPFAADKAHIHHRIVEMGHSQQRAVLLLYCWTALVAAMVISVAFLSWRYTLSFGLLFAVVLIFLFKNRADRLQHKSESGRNELKRNER